MTDLKLGLLILGALIIIGVLLFNWWQERSLRREASQRFQSPEGDILMDTPVTRRPVAETRDSLQEDEQLEGLAAEETRHPTASKPVYADDVPPLNTPLYAGEAPATLDVETELHAHPLLDDEELPDWQAPEAAAAEATLEPVSAFEPVMPAMQPVTASELADEAGFGFPGQHDAAPEAIAPKIEAEPVGWPEALYNQIDLVAVLYLAHPASGALLREQLQSFSEVDKAVYAYGLDDGHAWQLLVPEQESTLFHRLACSLQLADRAGPVSRATLNQFQDGIDAIGRRLGAQVEWQGSPDPLAYALDLDQFCIGVDKLVGFHLVNGSSGPFTGTKFRGLAEASGLTLGTDGAFHYEADGQQLFSIVNQDNNPFNPEMLRNVVIRGVSFQLDIPRVKNCAEVFNQMVLVARQMAGSLHGHLVDDNQRPVGEVQVEKIRQQLKVIHAQMVARGIVPGGACAQRLFS